MRFKASNIFQSLTMAIVLASFVSANFGNKAAMQLWTEGVESIATLISLGVGLKMADRHFTRRAEMKYNRPHRDEITVADGEEP